MSRPAEQFSGDPDDRPGDHPREQSGADPGTNATPSTGGPEGARDQVDRRRRTLQEQAQATLAKAAKAHQGIARASAKRARALDELREWSSDPVNAKLLNPEYPGMAAGQVLTDAQASPRKITAWEDQEVARRTVTSEVACTLHLAERTAESLIGRGVDVRRSDEGHPGRVVGGPARRDGHPDLVRHRAADDGRP
ncbi:hypothetical protein [Cryobacterium sp.]|uniref:hypothetical protein n=1 Tax=Cryobacterium sp. TaxID=1926290 RepID=UPI00260CBA5F|nr:hypothetical protein [Cryobacterium sp.]